MLKRFRVRGFKSLRDVEVRLPRLAVLFGPNASGKSNFLDALQVFSSVATARPLSEAMKSLRRGDPIEAFRFPEGGRSALLASPSAEFTLEGDILPIGIPESGKRPDSFRYRVSVGISPSSGALSLRDEYLSALNRSGEPKHLPLVEVEDGHIRIRRKSPGQPIKENLPLNHTKLSDLRYAGEEYEGLELLRAELFAWETYYLDPWFAMRFSRSPSDVDDIGAVGQDIGPFLYRLRSEHPKHFEAIRRTLKSLVPSVEDLSVDLDTQRGKLDILIRQEGVDYSSEIVSEGTLRLLALCAIALNPCQRSLVAFEEPENGVHPRRLELVAELLLSLALQPGRQVVVTTHSPLFCGTVLRKSREHEGEVALLVVRREGRDTVVEPFKPRGPLFEDEEIAAALSDRGEEGIFEGLVLRGWLDE